MGGRLREIPNLKGGDSRRAGRPREAGRLLEEVPLIATLLRNMMPADHPRDFISEARSLDELCYVFESIALGRHDRIDPSLASEPESAILRLSPEGEKELIDKHVINRVFRAWIHATWIFDDWHEEFSGATPFQALSVGDQDIWMGEAMLSVSLERRVVSDVLRGGGAAEQLTIIPQYFDREVLARSGGAFMYGLREMERHKEGVVAPNFDPQFRDYAIRVRLVKQMAESLPSYALSDMDDGQVYWRLSFEQAASRIVADLYRNFDLKVQAAIAKDVDSVLMSALVAQHEGKVEYVVIDHLFEPLWEILAEHDSRLVSYDRVLRAKDSNFKKDMKDPDFAHSTAVLYKLGFFFDDMFLLPADRYFNAVEIVRQDKETFINGIVNLYQILNKAPRSPLEERGPAPYPNWDEFKHERSVEDVLGMWSNPPTCFRFHPWTACIL